MPYALKNGTLAPVIALNLWTLIMEGWMYATRLPAIRQLNIPMSPDATPNEFGAKFPPSVRWKADNYNHLHEQPTAFYAVALSLAHIGADDKVSVGLAWTYVGLRVIHSLVQSLSNRIPLRFSVFATSSCVLAALTIKAATLIF